MQKSTGSTRTRAPGAKQPYGPHWPGHNAVCFVAVTLLAHALPGGAGWDGQ